MWKNLAGSFLLALENIRSNFFQTLLSILGMVIGVAALVAILSMIDGMEKFARDQIRSTTSLNAISVTSVTDKWMNNIRVKKDSIAVITFQQMQSLQSALSRDARVVLSTSQSAEITVDNEKKTIGSMIWYVNQPPMASDFAQYGRLISLDDLNAQRQVAVINPALVKLTGNEPSNLIDKFVFIGKDSFRVVGITADTMRKQPVAMLPITILPPEHFQSSAPALTIDGTNFEDVAPLKEDITKWLKKTFENATENFDVRTNEYRLEQAAKGFLLFKIIMGLIVGISIVVGGIGVMNVLLISVTQRTVEIGIRKAVGAKRRDITMQFLCESITISVFGSIAGLITGIAFTMAAIPIVKMMVDIPFQAIFTMTTIIIISIIAILVGIVFGTYPAIKASRLDPVEAIRKE